MGIRHTEIPDVLLIDLDKHSDDRGCFMELYSRARYEQLGVAEEFVQDNLSVSREGVLRGLHLQNPNGQGKLVQVVRGQVFDVAVDVRRGSPTFGRWVGRVLSDEQPQQLFVPAGFAHGFCVLSDLALFLYKCSAFHSPADELGIAWNDPQIGIKWPIEQPVLSEKDARHPRLSKINLELLPQYGEIDVPR